MKDRCVGAMVVVLAVLAMLAVVYAVGERGSIEPVARGGQVWSTKAYATSAMTVSTSVITISNASFGWGASDVADAEVAYISAHTAGIVVTWDGTVPTATLGMPVTVNSTVSIRGTRNVSSLRFIRAGASDARVSVTFEK